MRESVSKCCALAYVRESISHRRGTLSGRPPRGTYERAVKKSARASFVGSEKRVRARGEEGVVTRRKKGARAKQEVVNLNLLLGNRNSL